VSSEDTLKTYAGAPHGLTDTHKDHFNGDLLAFLKTCRQRRPSAFEKSECRAGRGRRGCQRQRRIYCRGKDAPMGPGKVRSNIGI